MLGFIMHTLMFRPLIVPSSLPPAAGNMPVAAAISSIPLFTVDEWCLLTTSTTLASAGGVPVITSAEVAASLGKGLDPDKGAYMASSNGPLLLSSSLPPVPAKVVKEVQAGQFIEFKELLVDNIAFLQWLQELRPSQASHLLLTHS